MKRINNYQKFRDEQVNEEFLGSLLAAAKGAFKNFLSGIAAPFKSIKDDFKKGLKREELKTKVTAMLDTLLKTTTDNINKAEDEGILNQIIDQFTKEFDEKCIEIDKEIQAVKESNSTLILEGAIKDGMIAGRVMLGMVKQKAAELKMEFDKKVAAAKDLAGKKAARVAEIKAIVDDFKKKITDDKYLDEQIAKYKTDNKIEGGEGGNIVLDWGDVEIEIELPQKGGTTRYKIVKSGSKKLVLPQGKFLFCDISGEAKKGEKVILKDIYIPGGGEFKIDGKNFYETGPLERIVNEKGEEVDTYKFSEEKPEGQEDLVKKLGELKTKKPDDISKVSKYVDFISDEANKAKIEEIDKIINPQ
jgi:hypothetical protein